MACPPSKRLRGLNQDVPKVDPFEADPFGDEDDFTQDDLEEIDMIASQAIASQAICAAHASAFGSKGAARTGSELGHGSGFHPSARPPLRGENSGGFVGKRGHLGATSRELLGDVCSDNRPQQIAAGGEESYTLLEAQHASLRRKLKEVEEEIVSKNGEIRMLRDSLKGAQQEKETQRQTLALLEKQKEREQSEKEKELSKKVQSLQSELQFKEAEINEMKSKLLSANKHKAANSPKLPNGLSQLHSSSSSASPKGSGFITTETFAAQLTSKNASLKTRRDAVDKQEVAFPDPFRGGQPPHRQHRGGVLLGLLLQQPLFPSSLCLSHLLSMSLSDACLTARQDLSGDGGLAVPRASLNPVQSLAVTGLNMLSQSRPGASKAVQEHGCPGAVLLLPLLDMHLSRLCQVLDAHDAASGSQPEGQFVKTGRPDEAVVSGVSPEDAGLAALRVLYLLIDHSDEVVQSVLATKSGGMENQTGAFNTSEQLLSHNALLQSVLHLCRSTRAEKESEIVIDAVKAVSVLIERTPDTHVDQLPPILRALCECVSAHDEPCLLSKCAAALACTCDHTTLTRQLCSQHEPCVILKLLQQVRNRTGKRASHDELILLDLQVVRLLNRLAQTEENWQSSSCPCYTEVVQTTVILLHRQWLGLRDSPTATETSPDADPSRSLLRECVLLLHRLLHHHAGFSASCRPLLHMYDQVIPALKDTLRKIPDLNESEELALEEICRPESDDNDDMDTDSGS
nr:ATR-interacting protein-like [Nerophis lumbriciformis]